jgi:hypothetical protein
LACAVAFAWNRGARMKLPSCVSLVVALFVLLAGCNAPCVNDEAPPGEQCGATVCSQTGYCTTDAGPPTCASKKAPGEPCLRDAECIRGACVPDAGCAFVPPNPSGGCN